MPFEVNTNTNTNSFRINFSIPIPIPIPGKLGFSIPIPIPIPAKTSIPQYQYQVLSVSGMHIILNSVRHAGMTDCSRYCPAVRNIGGH